MNRLVAIVVMLAASSAWAQSSDDGGAAVDMTAPACMSDRDCAGMAATPYCCVGSSCSTANVCVACVDFTGNPCVPVACDGNLCASTNGGTCAVAPHGGGGAWTLLFVVGLLAVLGWRARRRALVGAVVAAAIAFGSPVRAEEEPAVDVKLNLPPPPRRIVSIAWNPLPLIFGKVSLDVVVVPVSHHALALSPFYVTTSTAPIYVFDDMGHATQLATQTFVGWGGELGYRYYFGQRGPRGLFLGPSLILAWFNATAGNGTQTHFLHYGVAADVGYQMLIADRLSLAVGAGLQVVLTDKSIPPQQYPAKFYANQGVAPRLLASLGVTF